jgi:hypothetical protein
VSAAPDPARRHLEAVEDAPTLIVVNPETGQQMGTLDEHLQELKDLLAGAETDVRAWRTRHANLKRDKEAEAREDPLWPEVVALFKLWQRACNHPKSTFGPERFEEAKPFLERHGAELCQRAICGLAFDPFKTRRKNGTVKAHDGWHLAFGKVERFEECACKAPADWKERYGIDDSSDD